MTAITRGRTLGASWAVRTEETMQPRVLFLTGLVLGTLVGLASLLAPFTLVPGLVVWAWLIRRRPRYFGVSGCLVGFGFMWLLLLGQATPALCE